MNTSSSKKISAAVTPFRWDPSRREQAGRFLSGPAAPAYTGFVPDLRRCCARVLSAAHDCDLVLLGRSPESLFDYLGGALRDTRWSSRLTMLNLSLLGWSTAEIRKRYPHAIEAIRAYLDDAGLSPSAVGSRARPVAFVDLVASGGTFGRMAELLLDWAREIGYDGRAVVRRLRFVAITRAVEPSPKADRWIDRSTWVHRFRPSAISGVAVPYHLWTYMGDYQPKVARTYPPDRWGDEAATTPPRADEHLRALRFATRLYATATEREERLALASELAAQPAMRADRFRSLVTELRIPSADRRPTERRVRARTSIQARGGRG